MAEYIEKHKAVNLLTSLENEFQQFKPFKGFENAMYRKLCETEIAIGKLPAADVVPVVRCRDCRKRGLPECPMETEYPWIDADSDGFCNQGVKKKGEEHNND